MKRTTRSQLREGDRSWGRRLLEICQPTDRNLIEGQRDGLSEHNIVKVLHSVPGVNGVVGRRRFWCLPMEISPTCDTFRSVAFGLEMGQMIGEKSADAIVVSIENEEQKALPKRIIGKIHS